MDSYAHVGLASGCDGPSPVVGRLRGVEVAVSKETRALPNFEQLPPVGYICMDRLAVAERNGPPGFPGVSDRYEWFGIDFQGAFTVSVPGSYRFRLTSDDGAKLVIDGVAVLDNDGYHPTRSVEAAVTLAPGVHRMGVPYWQGPGPLALVLEVAPPGGGYEIFRIDRPLGYDGVVAENP
jgi:hypothetical protein